METFDENGSIITSMDYEPNIHSDIEFCKTIIETEAVHEEPLIIVTDGAYGSEETVALAKEKNITLVTTALIGKSPEPLLSEFKIDETNHVIEDCFAGEKPTDNQLFYHFQFSRFNFQLYFKRSNLAFAKSCL